MDPNATLAQILALASEIRDEADAAYAADVEYDEKADALAERVGALHTWILSGGFLPDAWRPERSPAGGRDN